jgi:hypothetical protein
MENIHKEVSDQEANNRLGKMPQRTENMEETEVP